MSASEVENSVAALATQPKRRSVWPVAITGAALLVLWWVVSLAVETLPGPVTTASELWRMALDGQLWSILWRITAFMAGCFSVAVVLGVIGGLAVGMTRKLDNGLSPYLAALQGMPTSLWIPVAAIVLGTEVWSLAAVVSLGAVPAIVLGTAVLPAALPGILTSAELGWSIAFRCLVAGEIFSGALSGTGIGDVISRSRESGDLTEMVATILIVLVFSVAVDRAVFAPIHSRLRRSRGFDDTAASR